MELAKSINELNKRSWYRPLKAAFVLCFVAAQILGIQLVRSRTEGKLMEPISFKLVGRLIQEEMLVPKGMTDEEVGRTVYHKNPALWGVYAAKYKKKYVIDPVAWYPQYSEIQRVEFCTVAFLAISLFFEVLRRAFYYVIFGRIFPRKKRRKRKKTGSSLAGEP